MFLNLFNDSDEAFNVFNAVCEVFWFDWVFEFNTASFGSRLEFNNDVGNIINNQSGFFAGFVVIN